MLAPAALLLALHATATAAAGAAAPSHIMTVLIDDLGFYDTAVWNPDIAPITPRLKQLADDGIRLER